MTKYLFNTHISTRVTPDPEHEDFEKFIDYWPGEVKDDSEFPEHFPIDDLVSDGHMEEVEGKKKKVAPVEESPEAEAAEE